MLGENKGVFMRRADNGRTPVFQTVIDGSAVTVRFSESESEGVKDRVRDILTQAYEDRFHEYLLENGISGETV